MTGSETLYATLFIAVSPALWILVAVLDRILPENSGTTRLAESVSD